MVKILCVIIMYTIVLGDTVRLKQEIKSAHVEHSSLVKYNEPRTVQLDNMEKPSLFKEHPGRKPIEILNNSQIPISISPRILDGHTVTIKETPYLVAFIDRIRRNNDYFEQIVCGGSIINERWILTAAHCFAYPNGTARNENIYVASSHEFYPNATKHEIDQIEWHQEYKNLIHDIAMVRVKGSFMFNRSFAPNCIQYSTVSGKTLIGSFVEVAGWGSIDFEASRNNKFLHRGVMKMITNDECNEIVKKWRYRVLPGHLCAKSIGKGKSCYGDSGGSLTANGILVGVQKAILNPTLPLGCERGGVVIATDVYCYLEWIKYILRKYGC